MKLDVELRDTANTKFRDQLVKGGGKQQVPCLKIETEGNVRWMYESDDIVRFLKAKSAST